MNNSKGKSIIISSEASDEIFHRSPMDLLHMGTLFGLTQDQSRDAITKNCEAVIHHSSNFEK